MTRKHQHQVTREMLESLIEDFAEGLYTDIDREDTGSRGSFGGSSQGTRWPRRVDGEALLEILDRACHSVPPKFRPRVVRDLISAAEAFAVYKAIVARAREADEQS